MGSNDDLFHDVIMSEEISQQDGFEHGQQVGREQGRTEGNRLGWEKGAAIGSEVGFYTGFSKSLLEDMEDKDNAKPRVIKTLGKVVKLTEEFPLSEPLNPELQNKLEEIRTKFKQVCSQFGIKPDLYCFRSVHSWALNLIFPVAQQTRAFPFETHGRIWIVDSGKMAGIEMYTGFQHHRQTTAGIQQVHTIQKMHFMSNELIIQFYVGR